ncbi:hypothetical protein ES703_107050 [subsurface metagenome]
MIRLLPALPHDLPQGQLLQLVQDRLVLQQLAGHGSGQGVFEAGLGDRLEDHLVDGLEDYHYGAVRPGSSYMDVAVVGDPAVKAGAGVGGQAAPVVQLFVQPVAQYAHGGGKGRVVRMARAGSGEQAQNVVGGQIPPGDGQVRPAGVKGQGRQAQLRPKGQPAGQFPDLAGDVLEVQVTDDDQQRPVLGYIAAVVLQQLLAGQAGSSGCKAIHADAVGVAFVKQVIRNPPDVAPGLVVLGPDDRYHPLAHQLQLPGIKAGMQQHIGEQVPGWIEAVEDTLEGEPGVIISRCHLEAGAHRLQPGIQLVFGAGLGTPDGRIKKEYLDAGLPGAHVVRTPLEVEPARHHRVARRILEYYLEAIHDEAGGLNFCRSRAGQQAQENCKQETSPDNTTAHFASLPSSTWSCCRVCLFTIAAATCG